MYAEKRSSIRRKGISVLSGSTVLSTETASRKIDSDILPASNNDNNLATKSKNQPHHQRVVLPGTGTANSTITSARRPNLVSRDLEFLAHNTLPLSRTITNSSIWSTTPSSGINTTKNVHQRNRCAPVIQFCYCKP